MSRAQKALLLALIQLLMVASMGAKMLYDRKTRPRAWARSFAYDPNLLFRGRYVRLQLEVSAPKLPPPQHPSRYDRWWQGSPVAVLLTAERGQLTAQEDQSVSEEEMYRLDHNKVRFQKVPREDRFVPLLVEPILFFIPEHIEDPARRQPGEELWVEVTLPKKGPPRPIRLAVKYPDGRFTPMEIR